MNRLTAIGITIVALVTMLACTARPEPTATPVATPQPTASPVPTPGANGNALSHLYSLPNLHAGTNAHINTHSGAYRNALPHLYAIPNLYTSADAHPNTTPNTNSPAATYSDSRCFQLCGIL